MKAMVFGKLLDDRIGMATLRRRNSFFRENQASTTRIRKGQSTLVASKKTSLGGRHGW